MERTRLSPQQRREIILDAARRTFVAHGYEGASMRRIAHDSGVTTPVLYDHFESKRALYLRLMEEETDALVELTNAIEPGGSIHEMVAAAVDVFFGFVEQRPTAWRLLMRDSPGDPEIAASHRQLQQRGNQAIIHALERIPAFAQARAPDDQALTEARAVALRAMINGLASWWWDHPDVAREDVASLATSMLSDGLPGTIPGNARQ